MYDTNRKEFRQELDYYIILGVSETSTRDEIRSSYRRLVLDAHPDKNPQRREWAEHRIRLLIEAYEILGNDENRRVFDIHRKAALKVRGEKEPFYFTRKTPGARALLILFYMTNKQEEQGAEILAEMEEEFGSGYLKEYLCREDYLDSLFLLAEHYIAKKNYLGAAERLRAFYHHECRSKFPRHYYDQVIGHLRNLYLRKLPGTLAPLLLTSYLSEAAEFNLKQPDEILRLHLLADAALDSGNLTIAHRALESCGRLAPESRELVELQVRLASLRGAACAGKSHSRRPGASRVREGF